MNINLFKYAPKELVTDAFLTWLFYFIDSDLKYSNEKQILFNELILRQGDNNKPITKIKVVRQDKKKNGRSDIILYFNQNNIEKKVLFENKTWTTTSFNQLNGYKKDNPNFYRYFYLKLAYVNYYEKKLAKQCGYDVITSFSLSKTLKKIAHIHLFVRHYIEYIDETFVNYISKFSDKLLIKNNLDLLKDGQAQQYLIDILYQKLDNKLKYLKFENGSSFGRPWTELDIAKKDKVYGDIGEFIFWRIDIRSNKSYIRLNQYAYIGNKYKSEKKSRLYELRELAKNISKKYNITQGKISNKGIKESEIIIFFLDVNKICNVIKILADFSIKFENKYQKDFNKGYT